MDAGTVNIVNMINELGKELLNHWLKNTVFTWKWWTGLFFTIVPWIVWIIIRKRDSTSRLMFAGFFAMLFASVLDFMGVSFSLWYYEYKILPVYPAYIPWDFSLIPVSIMILLQYKSDSYLFIKTLFFAAFSAFVAEPFFVWMKLYFPIHWSVFYSFPLYAMLYLFCYYLSNRKSFMRV